MLTQPRIDPALVEGYVRELARHGAYGETGVWRTVYSPEWLRARDQYETWCREAGLRTRRDAVGNVWGVLEGTEGGKSVVSGSHIDSQRPGGRYDGALGAIAALIALRSLKEQFGRPRRTLEALALCEEESSRFPAANFWGSRAITGQIRPDEPETVRGYEGETIGEAMRSAGLDPGRIGEAARDDIDAFLELHIEQGPILEQAGLAVGVVTGITGVRHAVVEVQGRADHAGAVPMDLRRDPMPAAAEIVSGVLQAATDMGRPAVTTVGRVTAEPNLPAVVPERVAFTIDARHPDASERDRLYARHTSLISEVRSKTGLDIGYQVVLDQPPRPCDPSLVRLLEDTASDLGIPAMLLHSGAGHDSQIMSRIARVAMIFVRSEGGRSHTPEEFTSVDDAVAGIRVLAASLYKLAY
ncbi:MAG: allantoate amidohydrolase [Chloroflexi bacterium]|nr:allantoate amidohydrolase [Chloroflexota bacterium]